MVWGHFAAIFLFSGPFFYVGLWMLIDPVGVAMAPLALVRLSARLVQRFGEAQRPAVPPEFPAISARLRTFLRAFGAVLVLFALAI